jgi:hypothetical protein
MRFAAPAFEEQGQGMWVRRAGGLVLSTVLAWAGAATAQTQPDPIGALLDAAPPAEPTPPSAPWTPPAAASPVPPTVQPPAAVTPAPWARPRPATITSPPPPRPARDEPVRIDQTDRTPEGPPTPAALNYEARLRASFAAAQGLQGPLDGRWTLSDGGADLYDFQIVDTGSAPLEGVWRDLRRPAVPEATGFLSDIERNGGRLTFQFQPRQSGPATVATLTATPDGHWSGDLEDGGRRMVVALRRN